MKLFFLILIVSAAVFAQKPTDILVTATGVTIKVSDLSADTQKDIAELPTKIPLVRLALLEQLVNRRVFDAEAKARGITMGKLIADEKAKVKDPSEAEIAPVLEANRERLTGLSEEQARKQVIAFLRREPEKKVMDALFDKLKIKYKVAAGKGVNSGRLLPTDIVATVAGKPITGREFEDFVRVPLYEAKAELADVIMHELDEKLYATVLDAEAKSLNIDSGELIAREVTNKMKEFTDAERLALEDGFRSRLFTKYKVKVFYRPPVAPVQRISVDDDPATGPATAPVTVVMFSDFQCSACSAIYPRLKAAIKEFPGKVRFVVRDFPLESIHENAFAAARAAGAAKAQGKFFEYSEILYSHQDALDDASLKNYAAQLGLNAAKFELDFNSPATAAEIRRDVDDGESYAVNSTPTVFINGVRVREFSPASLVAAIGNALRKKP